MKTVQVGSNDLFQVKTLGMNLFFKKVGEFSIFTNFLNFLSDTHIFYIFVYFYTFLYILFQT